MSVVVVGVDRSGTATKALLEALQQARWRNASIVAVSVIQMPAYASAEIGVAAIDLTEVKDAEVEAMHEYLASIEKTIEGGFPVPITTEVVLGHPGFQILQSARRHDAELVVLGSRGLGGVKGLLLGSVTTYAVHHIKRALLVIPGDADEQEPA